MGCGLLLIVPSLLLALFPGALLSMTGTVDGLNPWTPTLASLIVLSPVIIVGILLIIQHRKERRAWERQAVLWQRAVRVWMTLRYCHRDHVVYRWPDVYFPPGATRQFVYDQVMNA